MRTPNVLTPTAVRRIRKRLGLTLVEFAELVHVHWNTVAKWERGEVGMRPSTAELIRRVAKDVTVREETKAGRRRAGTRRQP
jgi:DNA-binding transcriptional regulator YiaG